MWILGLKGLIGSLSSNVFERHTSTGSGLFSFFDGGFAQIFSQIASITVKKLKNTNFISSRHVKRENTSLPVDVRHSKTSLLKLSNIIARDTPLFAMEFNVSKEIACKWQVHFFMLNTRQCVSHAFY